MATIFIRTAIIYFIFFFSVRIVGKRQIGELQLSEFITMIMISELAVNSIQDISIHISYSIIPVIFLLCAEVIVSFLVTKSQTLKKLFFGTPSIIIRDGKIDQKQLSKLRISVNELLSELRICGYSDINDIDYAIIEQNGQISVFPKHKKRPATVEDLKKSSKASSLPFAIVTDGDISKNDLRYLKKDESWLYDYLAKHNIDLKSIYLMTLNKEGETNIIYKEEK